MTYIGVGSNIEPEKHISHALHLLIQRGLPPRALSIHYQTEPVKHKENPPYINGVWELSCPLGFEEIQNILAEIEKEAGRHRKKDPYASRTIDLDILLYNHSNFAHQDILERNFVYIPLLELDEKIQLPDGQNLSDLVNRENTQGISPLQQFTADLRSMIYG